MVEFDSATKPINADHIFEPKSPAQKTTIGASTKEANGILGPCSFDDCNEFADSRCHWKNIGCLSGGGCDELYCQNHGYRPELKPKKDKIAEVQDAISC